jgi:hypothetical protein
MGAIKVDTEKLRSFAKGYVSRSVVVKDTWRANKFAIDLIMDHIPVTYDVKLKNSVRSDELDFTNRINGFSDWFQEDSASLIKIAEDFEVIDGQTIQIIQGANDGITRASLIDAGKNLGLSTTITKQEVHNPDGSVSTVTVVRTINDNGTVTTTTTIHTVKGPIDATTADNWNKDEEKSKIIGGLVVAAALTPLNPIYGLVVAAGTAASEWYQVDHPQRGWQAGDTITSDTTIVVTEPLETPPSPNPSSPEPEITTTVVVSNGDDVISTETSSNKMESLID